MKQLLVILISVGTMVTISVSCKKAAQSLAPSFDANLSDLSFTLPRTDSIDSILSISGINIDSTDVFPLPFDFHQHLDLDSLVKANTNGSLGAADVKSVRIKTMWMKAQNADNGNNLSNFKHLDLDFHSDALADRARVLSFDFPYGRTDSVEYSPSSTPELRPYLNGKELYYNISGNMRSMTTKGLKLQIKAIVTVK